MLQSVAPPTQVCPINKSRNTGIHFLQLFFSLQFIQKCQRIICSHFLLSIISPTIPFAHPQHCCHLPAFLPDWPNHLCDFKSLSLSFRTRKFFPQKCFTDCDAVQFIFYKNWELVKSRESKRSHSPFNRFIGENKNLSQGPTSAIRIEFWSICIHICTYWFASVVIPFCKIYAHRKFAQNIHGINYYSMKKLLK